MPPIINMLIEILSSIFLAASLSSLFYALIMKRPDQSKEPKVLPKVSVMTYAYINDWAGNVIKRKIENFLSLNYPKNKYEIIVYDNGSTGKTQRILDEYAKKGLIKHYRSKKGYNRKGLVLDDVIRDVAKGDIVALTDPDGICERDWLMKHVCNLMSSKKIGASMGMIFCGNWYKNFFTRMRAIEDVWMIDIASLGRARISDVQFICGANYSFKRKAWKDAGGHGKTLIEDAEIANRLQKGGWRIAVTDAAVWQEEVEDVYDFLIQRLRWYSTPMSLIFHKKKIISTVLSISPWSIQAISLFSLVAFIFADNLALRIFSLVPFLISILALTIGLIRMKEKKFIPFILPYLTFDAAVSFICLIAAKVLNALKKEVRWERLSKCKYYHNGTKIRINSDY
jgi:cellulose synthase/poly-beta-1,6-N-acetylglucosamine synthase-like glycosyltransferase